MDLMEFGGGALRVFPLQKLCDSIPWLEGDPRFGDRKLWGSAYTSMWSEGMI